MVRATALRTGVCAGLVCCDRRLRPVRPTSGWAGRWRCLRDHLPHMGLLPRPDHVHVPAPPGQHHDICRPRVSHDLGEYRLCHPHRSQRSLPFGFRPGSQLFESNCGDGALVPARRGHLADSPVRLRHVALPHGGADLVVACSRKRSIWLGTNSPDHRGLPPTRLDVHRELRPSTGCRRNGLCPGCNGLRIARAMDRSWHSDRTGDSHSAVHPARRHPALRCRSSRENCASPWQRCRQ